MGQILNRIIEIAKSNLVYSKIDNNINLDIDTELNKIIEELSNSSNDFNISSNNEEFNINSAYITLQIDKSASIEEIKTAYKKKIKEYHPDRLQNFGDEIRNLAVNKTKQINNFIYYIYKTM